MPRIEYGPPAQAGVHSLQYLSGADDGVPAPEGTPMSQRAVWLGLGLGGIALATWGPKKARNWALAAAALALLKV
jgi:hypothetical protein